MTQGNASVLGLDLVYAKMTKRHKSGRKSNMTVKKWFQKMGDTPLQRAIKHKKRIGVSQAI
jgi:hypothetical protein